jgi:Fur family peroxide stress response transcriptional regulator
MNNRHEERVSRRIEEFMQACRSLGLKNTHQRIEVFRELAESDLHPGAEEIYRQVRRRVPTISLDTVYRTLRMLEEKGLIARVGPKSERARFDPVTETHHHYICEKCGVILDFTDAGLLAYTPPGVVGTFGSVSTVHVEVCGICRDCQKKRPKSAG